MNYFVGLAANDRALDHSTLTASRRRGYGNGHMAASQEMLKQIVAGARELGVEFGRIQALDSAHTVADVNTQKDVSRQNKEAKGPRDPSAQWGPRKTSRVKNSEGQTIKRTECLHGY